MNVGLTREIGHFSAIIVLLNNARKGMKVSLPSVGMFEVAEFFNVPSINKRAAWFNVELVWIARSIHDFVRLCEATEHRLVLQRRYVGIGGGHNNNIQAES